MRGVPLTEQLLTQIGSLIAQFTVAMKVRHYRNESIKIVIQEYRHPFFKTYTHEWSHREVSKCRKLVYNFADFKQRSLLNIALDLFEDNWNVHGEQLPHSTRTFHFEHSFGILFGSTNTAKNKSTCTACHVIYA